MAQRSSSCGVGLVPGSSRPSARAAWSASTGACSHPAPASEQASWLSPARFTPMRFADLEAVTVDGFGTLLELESPVPRLIDELVARGVDRSPSQVAEAFAAE